MQAVSAGLIAACQAAGQQPVAYVEVSWDGTGVLSAARAAAGWTNETPYLIAHRGELQLSAPGDELTPPGQVGQLTLTLDNKTQRYSWLRADGPLYANIGGAGGPVGKRVRLWQGYRVAGTPEYVRIFTGVITNWSENSVAGTVEFKVQDMGWEYAQQQRMSSDVAENLLASDWIEDLANMATIPAGDQVLDQGIYRIPYVWLDDEAIISEIWDVATADGGRAYFDQLGKLHFENVLHWATVPHTTVQWAFGERDFTLLDPTFSTDDLATKIIVEYLPRAIGAETMLYTMRQMRTAAPNEAETFEARFTYPAYEIITPQASGDPIDYRVASAGSYNMASVASVTLDPATTYAQKTTVTLTNTSASLSAALQFLQIRGYPLLGGPIEQVEVTVASPAIDFSRDRSVRGNPYIQTWPQANALAQFLAKRCARVRPVWTLRGVPGVPQLELGDRVSFVDRRLLGTGITREGMVTRLSWVASGSDGYKVDVGVLDTVGLYDYLDWFYVGVTALGAHGRAWH